MATKKDMREFVWSCPPGVRSSLAEIALFTNSQNCGVVWTLNDVINFHLKLKVSSRQARSPNFSLDITRGTLESKA